MAGFGRRNRHTPDDVTRRRWLIPTTITTAASSITTLPSPPGSDSSERSAGQWRPLRNGPVGPIVGSPGVYLYRIRGCSVSVWAGLARVGASNALQAFFSRAVETRRWT